MLHISLFAFFVYSESVLVAQSCMTLCDPRTSLPGSLSMEFSPRILEWVAIPRDLPDSEIKPGSPTLQGRFFTV